MVMEAVTLKVHAEDREAAKQAKKKDWKKDTDHLKGVTG